LPGWHQEPCELRDLARLLHDNDEPVVFLNGRAEIGPRALGNRSILAPAGSPKMKDLLNEVKEREFYRPVAPICLEESAPEIFSPGTPDPYMLFDHAVREDWKDRVPAVCHLDGTARLQTVNRAENAAVHELLTHYHELSGIPLLCNTSANHKGSGFFPDVRSAMEWGRVRLIWSDGTLFTRAD
ncbi:carbamoyltransferase C-terminal domain-containing protein, partial [Streptomyces sp. MBT33]